MKIISSLLLFVLFTAGLAQDDTDATTTTEPPSTTIFSSTSVTTTDSDVTTTEAPTTTSVDSTTASAVPTTTTLSSTTSSTTPSSTTSSSTQSSTVSSSSGTTGTTASSTVTPSVAPTEDPNVPHKCQFNVTESGVTCIRADIKADFIIDVEGKKHTVLLNCNASYSESSCASNETQILVLSEPTYTLTMAFEKKSDKVLVQNITFSYNLPEVPRATVSNYSEDLFHASSGKSYLCKSKLDVSLENVTMEIHEVQIQAFLEKNDNFSEYDECPNDDKVSDIVPIAVGIALAALIIIVLIAYLVGRRRSRQKGYQSV